MAQHLLGMHDWSPDWGRIIRDAGLSGWAVTTHALSEQHSYDYRELAAYNVTPLARLNWGYGSPARSRLPTSMSTLPMSAPPLWPPVPAVCAGSSATSPITPMNGPTARSSCPMTMQRCFTLARRAIQEIQPAAQVMAAAVAPWDDTTKYPGNEKGDWLQYMAEILAEIVLLGGCDGLAIHSYIHGSDPALIYSTATMDPPFADRYFHFLAYQDTLGAVPPALRSVPIHLTEFDNCNGPWLDQNDGLIASMAMEVDSWNRTPGTQKINSASCYRHSSDDWWTMSNKPQRMTDFAEAVSLAIPSPAALTAPPGPEPEPEPEPEPTPDLEWDARLTLRGASISPAMAVPDTRLIWRCTVGRWFNEQESQGRHNVYVDVRTPDGNRAVGEPIEWGWPGEITAKDAENKSDPWLTAQGIDGCAADFPMHHTAPTYWVGVAGASDVVQGLGLGDLEQPGMTVHTSYYFLFELVTEAEPEPGPEPPEPEPNRRCQSLRRCYGRSKGRSASGGAKIPPFTNRR